MTIVMELEQNVSAADKAHYAYEATRCNDRLAKCDLCLRTGFDCKREKQHKGFHEWGNHIWDEYGNADHLR